MKKAFTLAEILIVVAILGILAAIVLPQLQSHAQEAKEAAAKDNLRILRNQIELYAAQHNDVPPGHPGDNPGAPVFENEFKIGMIRGNYLSAIPKNPFNNKDVILIVADGAEFPPAATGEYGWLYQARSKTIKLDWPGTDKDDISYYDY